MSQFKCSILSLSFPILLPLLIGASATSLAQSKGSSGASSFNFSKRADAREAKRWTLEDWLAQKDRSHMMDLWLSLNSPSPYELMLGVGYKSYSTEISSPASNESYVSAAGEFSAYAQIFGLTAEYENNSSEKYNDLAGLFNLRVFGSSVQSSAITLHYGLRTRTMNGPLAPAGNDIRLAQQFGQVSLQLYLRKYFGIDGQYRFYLPTTEESLGDVKSDEFEAGAFIDFQGLRIYGSYFKEKNQTTAPSTGAVVNTDRTGIRSGIKIFF